MKWNVYLESVNNKDITVFDVFDHVGFRTAVKKHLAKANCKETFAENLRREALYHFWSKSEYEVIITSWPPYITRHEVSRLASEGLPNYRTTVNLETQRKFSVYDQLMLNWDAFVDYCWSFKNKSVKVKVRRLQYE